MKGVSIAAIPYKALMRAAFLCFVAFFSGRLQANDPAHETMAEEVREEEFKVGELILDHIGDSHDWHLWGHTHLPLIPKTPVGLEVFSSARFVGEHHHPTSYTGKYGTYAMEGKRVVALDAAGHVDDAATAEAMGVTESSNQRRP